MSPTVRWICGLATLAILAVAPILMPSQPPPEPLDERRWTVESVMLLDEPACASYVLNPPFRVIRDGRVTLSRTEAPSPLPALRVDFTVDGQHVTLFSRVRKR